MSDAAQTLVDRIDYYLAEREALNEHTRQVNERLRRGEIVSMSPAPVASIEDGWALLKEARDVIAEVDRG